MRCCTMFLLVSVMCLVGSALSQEPQPPVYRLPDTITPLSYLLKLMPNLDTNTTSGTVLIELNTTSDTSEPLTKITLNLGKDVTVNETRILLLDYSGKIKKIGAVQYDDANTLIKLVLPDGDSLEYSHRYRLSLEFQSLIYSEPKGLFTGSYNSTSKYLASYLRPTHARDVFPCFDEPSYKVPVMLQVLRPATYSVVSTAPISSSSHPDEDNMVLDTFQATTPISIHSLGLFISQVNPVSTMGVMLYAPIGTPSTVPYLADLLSRISSSLGPFPVAPLNLVVLPDRLFTILSGYGFVFISPEVYNGQISSLKWMSLKLQLTEAFLRQFLEYLKTPHWWCEIWLSESVGAFFATTVQPEADQPWYKEWLRVEIRSDALGADFSNGTRAVINHHIKSRWDIDSVLANQTIRNKGLSVLTMWNDTMPEGVITKTILDYINIVPNNTVTNSNDFMTLMVANIVANTTYNVTSAISQLPYWGNSSGYPVVSYWPQSSTNFMLSQSPGCPDACAWAVPVSPQWPISISYSQNTTRDWQHYRWSLWLLNTVVNISVPTTLDQWTIFNLEAAPYRVNYANRWQEITAALQADLVPSSTPDSVKAMIQDDAVALALLGCLRFSTMLDVLSLTQRYQLDWFPVAKAFDVISAKMGSDYASQTQFQMFAATLFSQELLSNLDLKNRSAAANITYVRALLTPWLCQFNLGNCRQAVVELSQQLLQGNLSMIDPNDLENVACYGARYNNSMFDDIWAAYRNTSDLWLKHLYTTALGCVSDPNNVQRLLQTVVQNTTNNIDAGIATSDAKRIVVGLARTLDNSATVLNFVVSQAPSIQAKFGTDCLSNVIKELAKFRVDLSQLGSLTNASLDLDPYVLTTADLAMAKTNSSTGWWKAYGTYLEAALPQLPTTPTVPSTAITQGPTGAPTPTPTSPSSATSLMNLNVFSLIAASVLILLNFNF